MNHIHPFARAVLLAAFALPVASQAADAQRQADVARRGAEVMPFDLAATTHVFTKTRDGGTQRVVAKRPRDVQQVWLARQHLKEIRAEFERGDFSAPQHIHGATMPGLAQLKQARAGAITIRYRDVPGGGELVFRTRQAELAHALHAWFDTQLADHGHDAMEGDVHHDMDGGR
jgi:hypothetical protein